MHVLNPDHHIVNRGADLMILVDHHTGAEVVIAERAPVVVIRNGEATQEKMWIVGAPGVPNKQCETRRKALEVMPHMAHDSLGPKPNGDGYITITPHGLADMP